MTRVPITTTATTTTKRRRRRSTSIDYYSSVVSVKKHLIVLFCLLFFELSLLGGGRTSTTNAFIASADKIISQQRGGGQQQQQQKQSNESNNNSSNNSNNNNNMGPLCASTTTTTSSSSNNGDSNNNNNNNNGVGKLEELKAREAELSKLLAKVRMEKLNVIRSRPLTIGIIGFGRFGQFIAETFKKYGKIIVTSRSDYTDIANSMGVTYVPMSNLDLFFDSSSSTNNNNNNEDGSSSSSSSGLDVIVVATSILSFESTIINLIPYIKRDLEKRAAKNKNDNNIRRGPLIVDVASVKEHPRDIMLKHLPIECDILCTHPMFGPDSGKNGWDGLTFVYEKTRIDGVVLQQPPHKDKPSDILLPPVRKDSEIDLNSMIDGEEEEEEEGDDDDKKEESKSKSLKSVIHDESFIDNEGKIHSIHEESESHIESIDRMERFLSIFEEEGCKMVNLSCKDHDTYASNSQFITHLMGRVLNKQGLISTPIDTKGYKSVLQLIKNTNADSFDLFYGLYKYNYKNSLETIKNLQNSLQDVVTNLHNMDEKKD